MSHPVQVVYSADEDRRRSRLVPIFGGIMIIPHAVVLYLYRLVAMVAAFCGGVVTFFTKRNPEGIHNFVSGFLAYENRVNSYMLMLTPGYPPFPGGEDPYPVAVSIAPPAEQGRLGVFFRFLLAIPAMFVFFGLAVVMIFTYIGTWFAVLFTGKISAGCQAWGEKTLRYSTRFSSYQYWLTDVYPSTEEPNEVTMAAGVAPVAA